jgi:hypothetical protein
MRASLRLAAALSFGIIAATAATAPAGGDKSKPEAPAPAPSDDKANLEKWAEHVGDLPFVFGFANGMKEVEFTGRPPMYFFTATW